MDQIGADVSIRAANNADRERIPALVFGVLIEYGLPPNPEATNAEFEIGFLCVLCAPSAFSVL